MKKILFAASEGVPFIKTGGLADVVGALPKGIDKASSIDRMLSSVGLTRENTICCGDGYNDLTMIEYAGVGVAMANAQPKVKEKADYITASNDEDGIVQVIEEFIL